MPGSVVVSQQPARSFSNVAPARTELRSERSFPSLPLRPRISPARPEGQTMYVVTVTSCQGEEVVGQGDALDHVLVCLVVPGAGDELDRPGAGQRPAAQGRAVAVLLHDVDVSLEQ